ncbi:MAG TPA: hypothetical protein VG096_06820 [Bryobacteraceae bacterium]|jgi:hypothetical protein|nr:hypothetical protein [Bryobacteraceae bacterium]
MSDEFLEPGFYESSAVLFEPNAVGYVEPFTGDLDLSNECSVCLGEHNDEIHAATVSVRGWFREEVTKSFRIQPEVLI